MSKKYPFVEDEVYEHNADTGAYDLKEDELPENLQSGIKKLDNGGVSVFGSDMDISTKKKLEARQHLNHGNRSPNESIQSRYSTTNEVEKYIQVQWMHQQSN